MARYSKQREVIENILKSTKAHPSAAEVYAKAREEIPNISLGTVYRNLDSLSHDGSAQSFTVGDIAHFDGDVSPHPHFFCVKCGKVKDLQCDMEKLLLLMNGLEGCKVDTETVLIGGVCSSCI
ncbi:MAG: transcriptional repressor [Clostridia bacterium]|nr:transcriptional repressor [Clostridia bacterium]